MVQVPVLRIDKAPEELTVHTLVVDELYTTVPTLGPATATTP
jgi:hypothetical protein